MSVFELILSQRFNIHQVNLSLPKDVLRPTAPFKQGSDPCTLFFIPERTVLYSFLPVHSNFVMPHLTQNPYHYLKEKCSKIHLWKKKKPKQHYRSLEAMESFLIPKKVISTGKHVCTSPRSAELERKRSNENKSTNNICIGFALSFITETRFLFHFLRNSLD